MNLSKLSIALAFSAAVCIHSSAYAGAPRTIAYQGRLTDNTGVTVADGPYLAKFIIYDASSGGTALWNSNFQTVNIVDGLFAYDLGSNSVLPGNLFADTGRWLGITVGTDPEIAPRTRITSQAFAIESLNSETAAIATTVVDNSITASKIVDNSIGSVKLSNESGIAQGREATSIALNTTGMVDLTTVTITIPQDGYIFLQGRTSVLFNGATSMNAAKIQIDETSGGSEVQGIYSIVGFDTYASSGWHNFNCTSQRTYFKTAGSYTFRLEGKQLRASTLSSATAQDPVLTAIYIPSSYGAVATVSP